MFVLGLIGIGYTVFMSIFGPQKKAEAADMVIEERANNLRLEYDKKFISLDDRLAEITKNNQNHLHTIEQKQDTLTGLVIQLGKDVVRLETTINIKLPK